MTKIVTADTRELTVSKSRSRLLIAALALVVSVTVTANVHAGSLPLQWSAPTTNADGTALADLANYRIYLGTTTPTCPGASFHPVSSSTSTPASGEIVASRIVGLSAGTMYFARVTAVDSSGNESGCSSSASGSALVDFSVTPTTSTSFGSITVGSSVTRTFTVQNTSLTNLSGSVSVGAPFTVISGSAFSLAPGASHTATVRFAPTSAGSFAGNVNVTADGDTLSRAVSGSATATTVTLSVTRSGAGTGTVTSSPAGIACGTDCSESVTPGTQLTLSAAPATGSTFAGWGGACSGIAACTVTVSAATSVTATFTLAPMTLSVTKSGTGTGTVTSSPAGIACGGDCSESVTPGTQLTLSAAPAIGSTFAGWSGACSGTAACTVTVSAATTVTATFSLAPVTLSVTKSGTGTGTVTSSPSGITCGGDCSESVTPGTQLTLTAAPAAGSTFAGWSGACSGIAACTVTVSAATAVTATFNLGPVALAVTKNGTGSGTVTSSQPGISCGSDCSETAAPGTQFTLSATPAAGSTFAGWGGACGGTGPCTVTVNAATSVTATFTLIPVTLSVTTIGAGTVTSVPAGIACGTDCAETVAPGTQFTLTATAAAGSTFAGWSGACSGTAPCTVAMSLATTVVATFNNLPPPVQISVTKTGTGGGTVSSAPAGIDCGPVCTNTMASGTVVTLTAVAGTGSTFTGWSNACGGSAPTCTWTMGGSAAVTAIFDSTRVDRPFRATPAPVARSIAPTSATQGSQDLMLTVKGKNFVTGSAVRWNGAVRTTTMVNGTQLRAAITATDLVTAGSATVDVVSPGGGTSRPLTFTITPAPASATSLSTTSLSTSALAAPVPSASNEIVVDNAAPGVQDSVGGRTFTGTWCRAFSRTDFGPSSLFACGRSVDTYRWTPRIPVSGVYDVYVWVAASRYLSTSVPFVVAHAGGTTMRTLNQRTGSGGWVLHGQYAFQAGAAGYVEASSEQARAEGGTAGADAVRFVRRR